jgi:hypothetical protein
MEQLLPGLRLEITARGGALGLAHFEKSLPLARIQAFTAAGSGLA